MKKFIVDNGEITFEQIDQYIQQALPVSISAGCMEAVARCRTYLNEKVGKSDRSFYGINTGFGYLQNVAIDKDQLHNLQDNLLMSHACGLGEEVPVQIVRLMMVLKIKSLSYGHSGVSPEVVTRLADMHNRGIFPVVYTQGSLGASGDLAPLSHLCLPLIGLGEVRMEGEKLPAARALKRVGFEPIELQSKEGLALINGTQFMSAYGLYLLSRSRSLIRWAHAIAALSFDAFDGNPECFHPGVHAIRPHPGQVSCARIIRAHLAGSQLADGVKKQVQDPYSFRCIPQVHGATMDACDFIEQTMLREINSVTDNPNIFPDEDLILSGGNFHGQPLAIGLDLMSIAMSEIASISERRTYQLLSGSRGLPLFLVHQPGLHSGLMIPQYTAAGIVSENKQLSTPASVDTISSSNNQEDHVSMGANAATKAYRVVANVEKVLAIELLTAAQAMEFRRPQRTSPFLENVLDQFRRKVTFNSADRVLHTDLTAAVEFLRTSSAVVE